MAKWGYLARAYAIKEYAYMRANERSESEADTIGEVKKDIEIILEMAIDNYDSPSESPYEYRTIRQCKKWLKDFG